MSRRQDSGAERRLGHAAGRDRRTVRTTAAWRLDVAVQFGTALQIASDDEAERVTEQLQDHTRQLLDGVRTRSPVSTRG